jgi:signal transduction histidine kinase
MKVPGLLLLTLFITSSSIFCSPEKDSLYHALSQESRPVLKANIHTRLGNAYIYENGDSARKHYFSSLKYYSGKNDTLTAASLRSIAMSHIIENRLDSAILYSLEALDLYKQLKDSLSIAFINNNLGLLHINLDKYQEGAEYLIEALSNKESLRGQYPLKKLDIAGTKLNIGIALHTLEKYDKAIEYYEQAIQSYYAQEDTLKARQCEMQMANVYFDLKNYDKAEPIFRQLIADHIFENDNYSRAKLLNNLGSLLVEINKGGDEAEQILNEAYELNMAQNNKRSAAKNKNNIAQIYLQRGQYKRAISHANIAFQLAEKSSAIHSKSVSSQILADAFSALGQFKQSSKYYKMHADLEDEYFSVEKNRIVSEMEAKYNSEKKQQEIESLNAQQQIKDLKLQQKTSANRLISFSLLVTVIVLFIFIYFLRKVSKQSRLLDKQNAKLAELNNGLQKMFAIISHDLRNFVNGFKNAGNLLAHYQKKGAQEKLTDLSEKLTNNSQRLDELLDNLLNWGLSQSGLYELQKQDINTYGLINKQIELIEDLARMKEVKIINDIPASHISNFDPDNLTFIIRNLLSNALKFTQQGQIRFYIQEKNIIKIEDSGIGMPAEKLQSLFTIEKGNSTKGTAGEKGTGLGLKLVNDFVILNGAKLSVESEIEKGTCFCIDLNNERL